MVDALQDFGTNTNAAAANTTVPAVGSAATGGPQSGDDDPDAFFLYVKIIQFLE